MDLVTKLHHIGKNKKPTTGPSFGISLDGGSPAASAGGLSRTKNGEKFDVERFVLVSYLFFFKEYNGIKRYLLVGG